MKRKYELLLLIMALSFMVIKKLKPNIHSNAISLLHTIPGNVAQMKTPMVLSDNISPRNHV